MLPLTQPLIRERHPLKSAAVPLKPHLPPAFRDLPGDLNALRVALNKTISSLDAPLVGNPDQRRILNLACGRADETGVLSEVFAGDASSLEIVGADIRAPEIAEAAQRWCTSRDSDIQTRFHVADGQRFLDNLSNNDRFDLAFLRHQNYWNDPGLWGGMFEGALQQLEEDGLFVITSYFDKEHELACAKLKDLGAVKVAEFRNPISRALADAPGKSVDRHIAVFRRAPVLK